MKNVTISMDEDLHRTTRIEAAKAGKSMSRYIADLLEAATAAKAHADDATERAQRLERLKKAFSGPLWPISEDGRMPDAEERNARR